TDSLPSMRCLWVRSSAGFRDRGAWAVQGQARLLGAPKTSQIAPDRTGVPGPAGRLAARVELVLTWHRRCRPFGEVITPRLASCRASASRWPTRDAVASRIYVSEAGSASHVSLRRGCCATLTVVIDTHAIVVMRRCPAPARAVHLVSG